MHDLDRAFSEIYQERAEFEPAENAYADVPNEAVLAEADEMELAAELLSVTSEAELDEFLGKLIKGVGKFVKSGAGRALGGILKTVASKALPIVGNLVAPGVGGLVGGALASALKGRKPQPHGPSRDEPSRGEPSPDEPSPDEPSRGEPSRGEPSREPRRGHHRAGKPTANPSEIFGLELEGLSLEDQEFEAARYFVRFAVAASKELSEIDANTAPREAAVMAASSAAKTYAPGLLQEQSTEPPHPPHPPLRGQWIRRGNTIVVFGV